MTPSYCGSLSGEGILLSATKHLFSFESLQILSGIPELKWLNSPNDLDSH